MTWLYIIAAWCVVSLPVGILLGKAINLGDIDDV